MMHLLDNISLISLLDTIVSLLSAFILGSIIGIEREIRQRTAGLRTNVLVCVGAAMFVDLAVRYHALNGGSPSPLQVIAYVVSGVGFLGAGVIMRQEGNVRGINTAATLWASAAVGSAAGAGLVLEAFLGTCFVLAANTLLRPIVNRIERQPVDTESIEATYTFYLITHQEFRKKAQALLERQLDFASIPIRNMKIHSLGNGEVEIEAVLLPSSIDGNELDILTGHIKEEYFVSHAFWNPSTQN